MDYYYYSFPGYLLSSEIEQIHTEKVGDVFIPVWRPFSKLAASEKYGMNNTILLMEREDILASVAHNGTKSSLVSPPWRLRGGLYGRKGCHLARFDASV